MYLITENLSRISDICRQYNVITLHAFGSILTSGFTNKSDIDLLVRFNDKEITDMFEHFFDFTYELENLLGRKVDLVDESTVTNSYFLQELNHTKKLIYG